MMPPARRGVVTGQGAQYTARCKVCSLFVCGWSWRGQQKESGVAGTRVLFVQVKQVNVRRAPRVARDNVVDSLVAGDAVEILAGAVEESRTAGGGGGWYLPGGSMACRRSTS